MLRNERAENFSDSDSYGTNDEKRLHQNEIENEEFENNEEVRVFFEELEKIENFGFDASFMEYGFIKHPMKRIKTLILFIFHPIVYFFHEV